MRLLALEMFQGEHAQKGFEGFVVEVEDRAKAKQSSPCQLELPLFI